MTRAPTITPAPTATVGGAEASACLSNGGDCASCCGGCQRVTKDDGISGGGGFGSSIDFSGYGGCVCFEDTFDDDYYDVSLTNYDDCANVRAYSSFGLRGGEGGDALHADSTGRDYAHYVSGLLYGEAGDDFLTARGPQNFLVGGDGVDSCIVDDVYVIDGPSGCEDVGTSAPTVTPAPTGACPDVCDQTLKLVLTTDAYPSDTTWSVTSPCGSASGGPYEPRQRNTVLTEVVEVCAGQTYTFEIFDSYRNGICCLEGPGSYYLELNGDVIYSSNGDFGSGETYEFTVPDTGFFTTPSPTLTAYSGADKQLPCPQGKFSSAGASQCTDCTTVWRTRVVAAKASPPSHCGSDRA